MLNRDTVFYNNPVLNKWRSDKGLSIKRIGKEIGLSKQESDDLFSGKLMPSNKQLNTLSTFTGIAYGQLQSACSVAHDRYKAAHPEEFSKQTAKPALAEIVKPISSDKAPTSPVSRVLPWADWKASTNYSYKDIGEFIGESDGWVESGFKGRNSIKLSEKQFTDLCTLAEIDATTATEWFNKTYEGTDKHWKIGEKDKRYKDRMPVEPDLKKIKPAEPAIEIDKPVDKIVNTPEPVPVQKKEPEKIEIKPKSESAVIPIVTQTDSTANNLSLKELQEALLVEIGELGIYPIKDLVAISLGNKELELDVIYGKVSQDMFNALIKSDIYKTDKLMITQADVKALYGQIPLNVYRALMLLAI